MAIGQGPNLTLAQASALGTTPGAPTPMSVGAPAPGSTAGQAPVGAPPVNPVVAPHAAAVSVGTHQSASPAKRGNPPHGMFTK